MKIAIMTDMEGVAGVVNFRDWVFPEGRYYEQGKRLLTEETNAAIEGFFAAGADEITVIDGHGAGGIDPVLLDERAEYSRGWGVFHQFGLNDGFDAVAWVGQHAKAGTKLAHMPHTGSTNVLEYRFNGISMGEFGKCAAIAGFYGTPVLFGAGDRAFTEEARALIPQIHTVAVKRGVTLDDGADCSDREYENHNLGAVHLHHNRACALIREGARRALEDFLAHRENYRPFCPAPPFVSETWFRREKDCPARYVVQRHDSDLVAVFSAPCEVTELAE